MFRSGFGVIRAVVPIVYCGGLIYYFVDLSGSMEEAKADGLGPTVLGLGAVGVLFSIPLIMKIVRLFAGPRSPGSSGHGRPDAPTPDGESGFDADAAVARYMERRSTEAGPVSPTSPPAREGGAPATRSSFGRKIKS